MNERFEIDRDGDYPVLKLRGDIDYGECKDFQKSWESLVGEFPIVLDLAEVEYLDSTGLAHMLSISKCQAAQGFVTVIVVNAEVQNILLRTRLAGLFVITWSLEEAFEVLHKKPSAPYIFR